MNPPNLSFPSANSSEKRREILAQAAQLFQRYGYHATSMRDIAKAVNLRSSSLYSHIRSKEALLWEIVATSMQSFVALGSSLPAADPVTQLHYLIEGHMGILVRELPNASVLFHDWQSLSSPLRQQITQQRDAYEAVYTRVIQRGIQTGDFRVQDVKAATLFVLSALNWTYQWYRPAGRWDVNAIAAHYQHYLVNALR